MNQLAYKYEQSDLVYDKHNGRSIIWYIVGRMQGSKEALYSLKNIDDSLHDMHNCPESHLTECDEKVQFSVSVRGEFSQAIRDLQTNKKFSDVKIQYGKLYFRGSKREFDQFFKDTIERAFHSDFKVIGIDFHSIKS